MRIEMAIMTERSYGVIDFLVASYGFGTQIGTLISVVDTTTRIMITIARMETIQNQ